MKRVVVIDWGMSRPAVVAAAVRGERLTVESFGWLPAGSPEQPGAGEPATAQAEALRRLLPAWAGSGAKLLGLVGRSRVVLRLLRLPPAEPEELPQMVRFQAVRELSFPPEQAALDFDPIGKTDESGWLVLMGALRHEQISRFDAALNPLGLQLGRLGLRPYAAWSFWLHAGMEPDRPAILLNLFDNELELAIGAGRSVYLTRAARLRAPSGQPLPGAQTASQLAGEVRRTLLALANQGTDVAAERLVLAADRQRCAELAGPLSEQLDMPVLQLDPLQRVTLAAEPPHGSDPGAWLAAFGAALAAEEPWPFDFVSPKRPAARRDYRRPAAIAAGFVAAAVVGIGYMWLHHQLASAQRRIDQRLKQLQTQEKLLEAGRETFDEHKSVRLWLDSGVNPLLELERFSNAVEGGRELYLKRVTIAAGSGPGEGRVELEAIARERGAISRFYKRLGAQPTGPVQNAPSSETYRYSFKARVPALPPAATEQEEAEKGEKKPGELQNHVTTTAKPTTG